MILLLVENGKSIAGQPEPSGAGFEHILMHPKVKDNEISLKTFIRLK